MIVFKVNKVKGIKFYILLLITICSSAYAQHDSLIYLRDLSFVNESEKNGFRSLGPQKEEHDLLNLLLTPYLQKEGYNIAMAEKKINECVATLKEKIKDKSEAKKIKIIHQYVHQQFFSVYKLSNSLSDVFQLGFYNCVSGSAVFSIVLTKLGIPYQLMEVPSHVFLIAYPKTEKIMVESTMPEKGSYQFSQSIIDQYITALYKSKQISKEEFESTSTIILFEKYYLASGAISLTELVGIQYNNFALYALDEQLIKESLGYIKKAYFLNPCARSKYLLKYILFNHLNGNTYSTEADINNLAILFRFYGIKESEVNLDMIKSEYSRMLNTQLFENSAIATCEEFHKNIVGTLSDSILRSELDFIYSYELARLGLINGSDYKTTTKHLEAAYAIKPKNANLHSFVLENFSNSIKKMNDVELLLETIQSFEKRFNFLDTNFLFNTVKANVYLELAYQNFYLSNVKKGDEFLSVCDKMTQQKEVKPDDEFVEKAYAEAASYYFKKGNYAKAKTYLKSGLVLAPNSFGLQQRLKLIP